MRLQQFLKELEADGTDYDVSFTLSPYNDINPEFFLNSWLSDNAYNYLYPRYSIEDPDAVLVEDIAALKHIKSMPEWLISISDNAWTYNVLSREEMGLEIVDIEIKTDKIMKLYQQNKQNLEVL